MAVAFTAVLLLLLQASISAETSDVAEEPLYFMFVSSTSSVFNSSGTAPAVDLALEKINGGSSLLSGYTLRYPMPLDSKCNRTRSLDVFFDELRREDPTQYVAVVGCGCSLATEPVAEISHYYNLPTISYASSAELLSNRERFRSYFRTDPSEENLSPGLAGVVRYYGWRQVAILTQAESLFIDTQVAVKAILSAEGINVSTREIETVQNPLQVDDLFVEEDDTRVFILNMYALHARTILCQASQRGFASPRYTWITLGWYAKGWWRWNTEGENGSTPCSDEEMMRTLERSLAVLQYPVVNETLNTASNISLEQFIQSYEARAAQDGYDPTVTAPLAYDAVWALATALEGVAQRVASEDDTGCEGARGALVPLGNFTYDNEKLWCLLHSELQETDFLGVSGHVYFDEQGNRQENTVRVEQYRLEDKGSLTREVVAYLKMEGTQLMYTENESNNTVWPAGIPPDGTPITRFTTVATSLSILYYLLAAAGITFALACLGFNLLFRDRKVIRLTSPNLNYLIIAGTILLFLSVVFLVIPSTKQETVTIYCNVHFWLFSVGNTICFSVVLAKMWRVYYIFSNPTPKSKPTPPQDWHLLLIVAALVGIDVVILVIPTCLESARLSAVPTEDGETATTRDEYGVQVMYFFYYCHSRIATVIWIIISFAYKLFLQIVAIYFAFKTRKVKIKPLNDSKEIAAIIYVTSLILVASVGAGFALGHLYLNVFAAVLGGGRLVIGSVILALIFIPKMNRLWHDPNGDKIFGNTGPNSLEHTSGLGSSGAAVVVDLEKKVAKLESKLKAYEDPEKQHSLILSSPYAIPLTTASTSDTSADFIDEQKPPIGSE